MTSSVTQIIEELRNITQDKRPILVAICGAAGAGKSTLARTICSELREERVSAALVDIDSCTSILVAAGLCAAGRDPNDRDTPEYKKLFREAIHKQLFSIVTDQMVQAQVSCVFNAPFTVERKWAHFSEWLREECQWSGNLYVIHVVCYDNRERMRRIKERNLPKDAAKFSNVCEYVSESSDDMHAVLNAAREQQAYAASRSEHLGHTSVSSIVRVLDNMSSSLQTYRKEC